MPDMRPATSTPAGVVHTKSPECTPRPGPFWTGSTSSGNRARGEGLLPLGGDADRWESASRRRRQRRRLTFRSAGVNRAGRTVDGAWLAEAELVRVAAPRVVNVPETIDPPGFVMAPPTGP
jgi:hypothetical protein